MPGRVVASESFTTGFNEAAGADPADAALMISNRAFPLLASMRPRGQTPRMHDNLKSELERLKSGFNEAAGADPADAPAGSSSAPTRLAARFNEAAGADPADATTIRSG